MVVKVNNLGSLPKFGINMSITYFKYDVFNLTKSNDILKNLKWCITNHTLHLVFFIRLGQ